MNTRSTRRSAARELDRAEDEKTADPLVRPSIRGSRRSKGDDFEDGTEGSKTKTVKDKTTSGLNESTKIKTSVPNRVTSQPSPSGSKQKTLSKSRGDYSPSDSESDNEEDYTEDELLRTSAANTNMSSSKAADETEFSQTDRQIEDSRDKWNFKNRSTDDYSQEGGDMSRLSTLRPRKEFKSYALNAETSRSYTYGERAESVYKQQFKKAPEKEALLDRKKIKSFSDDEEFVSTVVKGKASIKPVRGTSVSKNGNIWMWIFRIVVLLGVMLGVLMLVLRKTSTPNAEQQLQVMNAFHSRFRKLPIIFPGQSQTLWQRSQRMLELQLRRGTENEEPAIILLTAARDAEHMLYCVGKQLAEIYASTLNSSYTVLSGLEMTSENSEDAKMVIDQRLNERFQANSKAAVLHRLELLPPGSLLILYKYCDHENAAFKNVALVLTVLLENSTMHADIKLNELEEAVYDFFKETFINQVQSKMSHNEMDEDKLGGVWSRISHVVLPVFPEKQSVKECDNLKASP